LIRTSAFLTTVFCNPFQRFGANAVQFIADIVNRNENAVVTWGFAPDDQTSVAAVLLFRSNGFKLVWLDGDRRAALERFEERARTRASSDRTGRTFRMMRPLLSSLDDSDEPETESQCRTEHMEGIAGHAAESPHAVGNARHATPCIRHQPALAVRK
jgi:hypothetical protein